ncbi:MAG TPA: class I SAM-dependent methyltransferase [Clostridiales bacterium]|nr:class I SAM-dependent methyltransferase [Clostridiales bacterium]
MSIINPQIDNGRAFDWGRTSDDYAKYRDIYPEEFYKKIIDRNLCTEGQKVLDLGTGTGVLPRNMYEFGAKWTGIDISVNQIEKAIELSVGKDIDYYVVAVEELDFEDSSFDVITACQSFFYFDHQRIVNNLYRILKPGGRILVLYMGWLPFEDKIAYESEKLVLKYNPNLSGAGGIRDPIYIPECYRDYFELTYSEEYDIYIHFTRDSWNGRLKACRGIGASLSEEEISKWEQEHKELLDRIAPEEFDVLHYVAIAELTKR